MWKPSERKPFPEAPFDLKDHDGPSMLWLEAYRLEDKFDLPNDAARLRELAIRWVKDRAHPTQSKDTNE
jgi:hypothetical protein